MRRIVWLTLIGVLALRGIGFAQGYSGPPTFNVPVSGLAVAYSTGTITIGGFQTILQAGSVTLTDNQTACGAPQFAACNILYWTASAPTVLSVTGSLLTGFAPGNEVVAYATTLGGSVVNLVTANLTLESSPGAINVNQAPLLSLCNALITKWCQPRTTSLSGF